MFLIQPLSFTQDGGVGGADRLVSEEQSQNGGGGGADGADPGEGQKDQPHPESTVPACVQDTGATNDSGSITERDQEEEQQEKQLAVHALVS